VSDEPGRPVYGPLAGLRILDMTMALAGAYTTMLLADMGAEVIKVESIQHYPTPSKGPRHSNRDSGPSVTRDYPDMEPGPDPWNRLSWFNAQARNKRDMTVDITRPRGMELFLQLVEMSDGLVENNTAGLLEKLGLHPERLLARNPRLIIVRMPPLGLSGPDQNASGFGWHFEDLAGMLEVQGYPDGPSVGSIFMDASTGPNGASAFLMALLQREQTGSGQVIELAQVENLINHFGDVVIEAALTDRVPPRRGNRSPVFVPQGVYPCRGEDQWLALSVRDDSEWLGLRAAMGEPEKLRRQELDRLDGRVAAQDEIDLVITGWTARQTKEEAFHLLQSAGVPAGPVMDEADAFGDPQLQDRGFFHLLEHRSAGAHFHPGANFRLVETPAVIWRAAPVLGQDNEYVYRTLLGVSEAEYDELVAEGHIGDDYL
jgi:crotonobetainyl-CoA:carnitine CoA-transferase CaiB-like acyl-CoA transferase